MTDWNNPTNARAYTSVLSDLNGKIAAAAKMDYTGDTNLPTGLVRYNSTTLGFEQWNGTTWVELNPWTNWTPTYGATGSMTFTGVTTSKARYYKQGGKAGLYMLFSGTTGGTANNGVTATLPFNAADYTAVTLAATVYEGGATRLGGQVEMSSADTILVRKYDGSNFGLGGGRQITVMGILEV